MNLPPPLDFENKYQRNNGIFIGFGFGLAIICFVAALFAYSTYSDLSRFLSEERKSIPKLPGKRLAQKYTKQHSFLSGFWSGWYPNGNYRFIMVEKQYFPRSIL